MPRYELTIAASYLAGTWGAFEGVRELVQNAKDAETEFHAPMTITHYANGNGQLRINNEGTTLKKEALLMGNTSKSGRSDLIGQWGEGLKVGILALLRDGYEVKIRTGSEVWIPTVEFSDKFEAEVLVFQVHTGRKAQDRVRVEVSPFSQEDWELWKPKFLFLDNGKGKPEDYIETNLGTLLLDPSKKGHVFVKGIATEHVPDLSFGYDLPFVDLDRDRRMVHRWDLEYHTAQIWSLALSQRPDLLDPAFQILMDNTTAEAFGFSRYLGDSAQEKMAEKFTGVFGEKALPVDSIGSSAKLEHLGVLGVVVPRTMREVLDKVFGSTEQNLDRLKKESRKLYSWQELSAEEKSNVMRAVKLVSEEEPRLTLDLLQITDFGDENLEGTYASEDGEVVISLSKKILSHRGDTLRVTLHEAAHMAGGDGEHSHVRRLETMWSNILERLLAN